MSVKTAGGLTVASSLHDFLVNEALPGTGIEADALFSGLADVLGELGPENQAALEKRDQIQVKLDDWHKAHPGPIDAVAYKAFLVKSVIWSLPLRISASMSQVLMMK